MTLRVPLRSASLSYTSRLPYEGILRPSTASTRRVLIAFTSSRFSLAHLWLTKLWVAPLSINVLATPVGAPALTSETSALQTSARCTALRSPSRTTPNTAGACNVGSSIFLTPLRSRRQLRFSCGSLLQCGPEGCRSGRPCCHRFGLA